MDELTSQLRREAAATLLLPLFLVSGATGLVYQTLWNRQLHLVFGTSTFAISTVLAAFMLGLALGGLAAARWADRAKRPLAIYGALEIGIGLYAALFPWLLGLAEPLYLTLQRQLALGTVAFGLLQFSLVGALLVFPTALMGATLPLLARFATDRLAVAGDRIGTLYAVNTLGAVIGTAAAGFWVLPWLGLWGTTLVAALANVLLGLLALLLDWRAGPDASGAPAPSSESQVIHPLLAPVAAAMALVGFASLTYEVAWTRLVGLMVGASVYAFSTMLLAFLVGIALGGKAGGPLADALLARGGQRAVLRALAVVEGLVAVVSYAMMYLYPELPYWYVWIYDQVSGQGAESNAVVSLLVAGLVMTPPAVLMGVAFPLAVRSVVGLRGELAGPVGWVYGANTLGGALGAFLAGFFLLPYLDMQGTLLIAGLGNLAAAGVCWLVSDRSAPAGAQAAAVAALAMVGGLLTWEPPWDPLLMTAGTYHYVSHFDDHSREGIRDYAVEKYNLVFYEEGLSTVVTVAENKTSKNLWLANNGKVDASTTTDMPTQILCSLLPLQFVEDPRDVLVIGLASGITAGALTLVPEVESLEIVELEPAIEKAARFFDPWNHQVLDDPRTRLVVNDGRNHLLLAEEGRYDVIVSEPSNPWITGVSNLFTREFWLMGKRRLKPGGVWSQWVQMYGMDDEDLRTLLATFASVYPHVTVYATIEDADLVLVGSDHPLTPTVQAAERLLAWPRVAEELSAVGIQQPLDLVGLFQTDQEGIQSISKGAVLNTDDNMRIEYSAPLHLHRDTSADNLKLLLKSARVPAEALDLDPDLLASLAQVYHRRKDPVRSVRALLLAAAELPTGDLKREAILQQARAWQAELEAEVRAEKEPGR